MIVLMFLKKMNITELYYKVYSYFKNYSAKFSNFSKK